MSNARIIRPNSGLGKSLVGNEGSPMSFTASVTGLTPGLTKVFDSAALQPGYRTPYVIDAITMLVKSPVICESETIGAFQLMDGTGFGGLVDFLFQTGHHAFSAKPIAAPNFTPRYMFWPDTVTQQISNPGAAGQLYQTAEELCEQVGDVTVGGEAAPAGQFYCVYKWLLPKPLLLLPGDVINASCQRHADLAAGTSSPFGSMEATVTYTGRALPPGEKLPKTQCVPWVGMFDQVDKAITGTTVTAAPWANSNREFENPFQRNWNVQRLVARNVFASAGTGNAVSVGGVSLIGAAANTYSLKITDPLGYQITTGFVPISAIANYNDSSAWTFSRPVGPRQRVNMEFDFGTHTVASNIGTGGGLRKMVSLVGYREEDL